MSPKIDLIDEGMITKLFLKWIDIGKTPYQNYFTGLSTLVFI